MTSKKEKKENDNSQPSPSRQPIAEERFMVVMEKFPGALAVILFEMANHIKLDRSHINLLLKGGKMERDGKDKKVIEMFVVGTYNYWDMINGKNMDFLPLASNIFKKIFNNKGFKVLLTLDNSINEPEILGMTDKIWNHLHAMVKISIHYIHESRLPCVIKQRLVIEHTVSNLVLDLPIYKNPDYLPHINLDSSCRTWHIDRKFESDDNKPPILK